ncbi:MAG: divergent polysaccharide deacetylase family protein, partial [Pseudomonadota bacterium]
AWVASLLYLLALGGGGAYVAYVAEAPPPVNDGSAVRVISPIEGEVAVAPAVEPGPTPDDPGTDPVVVTELPEPPDPIEPTPIEPSNVPDTVVVAPTPEPVAPAVEQPRTIVRAEGTPPQEPLASLQEPSEFGPLPIVFGNGRPHQVYARRVPIIDAPRIALVMTDLGLDQTRTQVAIERLPADVSLAFHAYAPGLDDWIAAARNDGHESLLAVPMEPIDYPLSDPGPNALLVDNTAEENLTELYKSLGAAEGYVGVTNFMGSALMADFTAIAPVMRELGDRGLLFIDDNTAINSVAPEVSARFPMPFARANRIIDSLPTPADIDEQLAGLEALAKINGAAIGFMQSYPITLQRLEEWLPLLNSRGIDLVPVSAVAQFGGGITEQAQQAEAADREPASEATNSDG